nr:Txe/YoeB family addiction module toxin [Thiothrix lacustris]
MIKDIQRDPFDGIGKPEPLRHNLSGCWSRRITETHRIVYTVQNGEVVILQCRFHY